MAPLRAVKHAISREVGHDPYRYMAYVRQAAKRYAPQIAAARQLAQKRKSPSGGRVGTPK